MDIVLIILGAICVLLGLVGSVIPMLPGPPLSYLGLILLHLTDRVQFTTSELITWLLLVIVVQVLDYVTPLLGTKKYGGSKWGNWGCVIGTLIGIFVYPPWGIIAGPFLGAFLGEMIGGKKSDVALKAGFGAFIGFLFGTITKLILCGVFIFFFIRAIFFS